MIFCLVYVDCMIEWCIDVCSFACLIEGSTINQEGGTHTKERGEMANTLIPPMNDLGTYTSQSGSPHFLSVRGLTQMYPSAFSPENISNSSVKLGQHTRGSFIILSSSWPGCDARARWCSPSRSQQGHHEVPSTEQRKRPLIACNFPNLNPIEHV